MSTEISIVSSSPMAKAELERIAAVGEAKYPFDKLEVGQSFTLPMEGAKVNSLQVLTSQKSKDGKRFKMYKHKDLNVIEVARLA